MIGRRLSFEKLRVRQRWLLMLILLGLILPLFYSTWNSFGLQRSSLEAALEAKWRQTVQTLATGMSDPVWNLIPASGRPLFESILSDPAVIRAQVFSNAQGVFLGDSNVPATNSGSEDTLSLHEIITKDGEAIGDVHVVFDRQTMAANYRMLWSELGLALLLEVVISAAILLLLIRLFANNERLQVMNEVHDTMRLSEERFQDMARNVPGVVYQFQIDSDGAFSFPYVSPTIEEVIGVAAEAVEADPNVWFELIHPNDINSLHAALDRSQSSLSPWDWTGRLVRPEGDIRWFHGASIPRVMEDGTTLWNGLMLDITEQVEAHQELRRARDTLELEVDRRTARLTEEIEERKQIEIEVVAAKEQAETASKAKSEFMSSMSHELRTPLNAIIGFSQALYMGIGADDPDKRQETLRHIADAGAQLNELVGDVLDFSKIEEGKVDIDYQLVHPCDVLEDCLPVIHHLTETTGIMLVEGKKSDDLIRVDPTKLRQVLLNLISNATKYNTPGGTVETGCFPVDQGRLRIYVKDSGLGIPDNLRGKVFEPFERLRNGTTDVPGNGIGLSISKRLVEHMNGTMGFESVYGEGSTFWVDFPIAQCAAA